MSILPTKSYSLLLLLVILRMLVQLFCVALFFFWRGENRKVTLGVFTAKSHIRSRQHMPRSMPEDPWWNRGSFTLPFYSSLLGKGGDAESLTLLYKRIAQVII